MACAICQTRRPRRFCPGVRGDICTLCCGAEREVTVDCPLDCEYLIEAHKFEKRPELDWKSIPNRDIDTSDERLEENQALFLFLAGAIVETALANPRVIDFDVREALDAAIRTHRTSQSGLVYETTPANPLAAAISRAVGEAIEEFRKKEAEQTGIHKTRESAILSMLVSLQHMELRLNNGRPRGRAFLGRLGGFYVDATSAEEPSEGSSLIVP